MYAHAVFFAAAACSLDGRHAVAQRCETPRLPPMLPEGGWPVPEQSGVSLCPLPQYREALKIVLSHLHLKPNEMQLVGGTKGIERNYVRKYSGLCSAGGESSWDPGDGDDDDDDKSQGASGASGASSLPKASSPRQPTTAKPALPSYRTDAWPLSTRTRPLVINAGDGSTGTRFVHCVMGKLGLRSAHALHNRCVRSRGYGTRAWDAYDHISDSPVGYQVAQLLRSHPGPKASVVLMLRNPWDWHRSRTAHHARARTSCWAPTNGGCGRNITTVCNKDGHSMEKDMLSNAAFVACRAFQGREAARIAIFSLFVEPEDNAMRKLQRLLNASGYPATLPGMAAAWRACNDSPRDLNKNHNRGVEGAIARVEKAAG